MTGQSIALEAIEISKRFGPLLALDKVGIRLHKSSVHALLGENGAGKSTLVKCIMGYYQPDTGELLVDDKEVKISNPMHAHHLGIGMIYQHFTLIPNMTVAENFVLARPVLPQVINWKAEIKSLELRMQDMPFKVDLHAFINDLSAGERQKVEILKQLLLDSRVLILDEPTSVLTPNEADEVLGKIRDMTRQTGLSVLMITHKFREVTHFADEVTVLRKGRYVGHAKVSDITPDIMASMMMGGESKSRSIGREKQESETDVLVIDNLQVKDSRGAQAVNKLNLRVRAGEILGIAGVSGNGQRELVEVLAGQRESVGGEITIRNVPYHGTRKEISTHGVYCLPEEPLRNACVPNMSVAENLAFRVFDTRNFARYGWLLNRRAIKREAKKLIEQFSIRTPHEDNPIGNLSGGNVQRAVLARELSMNARLLVVCNPCFGLDFNATADIRRQIMSKRNQGSAVLLVSEDLDEVLELSDRIAVISQGTLVYETTPDKVNVSTLGHYMAGH